MGFAFEQRCSQSCDKPNVRGPCVGFLIGCSGDCCKLHTYPQWTFTQAAYDFFQLNGLDPTGQEQLDVEYYIKSEALYAGGATSIENGGGGVNSAVDDKRAPGGTIPGLKSGDDQGMTSMQTSLFVLTILLTIFSASALGGFVFVGIDRRCIRPKYLP